MRKTAGLKFQSWRRENPALLEDSGNRLFHGAFCAIVKLPAEDLNPSFPELLANHLDFFEVYGSGQHRDQSNKHWGFDVPDGFTRLHSILKPTGCSSNPATAFSCALGAAVFLRLSSALPLTLRVRAV